MKEATVASMASEMGKIYNDIQNTCGLTCPNIARFPAMVKVWMVSICFFFATHPSMPETMVCSSARRFHRRKKWDLEDSVLEFFTVGAEKSMN